VRFWIALLAAACAQGQLSSSVSLSNGVRLQVSAELGQPTGQQNLTVEMARASGDSFYRIFWDQNHLAVYAYELQVSLLPSGSALRAVAKPAETEFASRYPDADAGKPVPSLSAEQTLGPLSSGQSAKVDLFEIPGMGLHVTETVRVQFGSEAHGDLRLSSLRVSAAGQQIGGPAPGSVAGRFAMFYVPGRGGFFFSREPVAGRTFLKAGTIDGNRMQFNVDNVDYVCASSEAIGIGELWVFHDASYRPAGNWTTDRESGFKETFFVAGSDSLGWWLP
jgi:hypothetical protein